jgi:hypothetical protein
MRTYFHRNREPAEWGDVSLPPLPTSICPPQKWVDLPMLLPGRLADATIGIAVRMGLHTGETVEHDGNYSGSEADRAARLMALAHDGQVLVSSRRCSNGSTG